MPSAASRQCSECGSSSSKYNCKDCHAITSTCSLPCSKTHKSRLHSQPLPGSKFRSDADAGDRDQGKGKGKGKGKERDQEKAIPDSTSSFLPDSHSHSRSDTVSKYIPINSYDSDQFQRDFNFLSHVGRFVSQTGRDLLEKRMIPPELLNPNGSKQNNDNHANGNGIGGNRPVGAAQHKRETLRKQLHFRALNVLLLPDGMEMRKKNGTAWLHKESRMIYTVELRFPLASMPSSTPDCSLSTSATNPEACHQIVLLNKIGGHAILQRLVLEELERRSSDPAAEVTRKSKGEGAEEAESNHPSAKSSSRDEPMHLDSTKDPIAKIKGLESGQVTNPNQNGDQNQNGSKGGKLSSRARKRLKKEAHPHPDKSKSEDPTHHDHNQYQNQNQKKPSQKSRKQNQSRLSDPDFKPDFTISSRTWGAFGIPIQATVQGIRDGNETQDQEVVDSFQELPQGAVLLLPIYQSRLRNETSLKYLDWFERQRSKEGNGDRIGNEMNQSHLNRQNQGEASAFHNGGDEEDGKGRWKGRGKGNESNDSNNSNTVPLGPRGSSRFLDPSYGPNQVTNSHSARIPNFNSSNVPHPVYTGPPPSFPSPSVDHSVPHYHRVHQSHRLPSRPVFPNGSGTLESQTLRGGNQKAFSTIQTASPSQPASSASQFASSSDPNQSDPASSGGKNPLVSNAFLSKLSQMIPNPNPNPNNKSDPKSQTSDSKEEGSPQVFRAIQQEFDTLSHSASSASVLGALADRESSCAQLHQDSSDFSQASDRKTAPSSDHRPASTTSASTSSSSRPKRTFISLAPTDSLEPTLKNLPEGYAVVEYATLELWSEEKVEEMKSKGEIEIVKLVSSRDEARQRRGDPTATTNTIRTIADDADSSSVPTRKRSNSEIDEDNDQGQKVGEDQAKMGKKAKLDEPSKATLDQDSKMKPPPIEKPHEAIKKPLGGLVSYGSDSDLGSDSEDADEGQDREGESKSVDKVAASELLTNNAREDPQMSENNQDEGSEEEEEGGEDWGGSGLASMARAFGLAPVIDSNKAEKVGNQSEKHSGGEKEEGEPGGKPEQVGEGNENPKQVVISAEDGMLGLEEELDWGDE